MAISYNNIPNTTVSRDLTLLEKDTQNVYESISVISKRANQIAANLKEEIGEKIKRLGVDSDNLEEVFENREQIETSIYYEKLPKPTIIATEEFLAGEVYFRKPSLDQE